MSASTAVPTLAALPPVGGSAVFPSSFGALDAALIVVYILVTVGAALLVRRGVHDMADFVVAGRSLRSSLGVATMIGSELGLVTIMFSAQKGFTGGMAAFHIPLVAGLTTLLVGLTGFLVVPLRERGVLTIPEFYGQRFGRGVRVVGGVILALAGILNMGLFLKAGSVFVVTVTGMGSPLAVKWVMTVLLVLVLFYVSVGGMLAVVVTDYIQFVLLSIGLLVACVVALRRFGIDSLVEAVQQVHGPAGFDPLHGDGFGLGYVVWMVFTAGLVSCAIWQTAVVRACSAESVEVVRRTYQISSIGFLARFLVPNFLGVCALAWVVADAGRSAVFLPGGRPADPETTLAVMPALLADLLPTGLLGLVVAGMLAAFMSTHDSYLLCWSSVLTQDVVAPLRRRPMSEGARLLLSRVLIFVIGVFLLLWSLWYPLQQDLWDYMAITGAIYFTGAFSLLFFGLYWRRASTAGAYGSLACGLVAVLGLGPVGGALGVGLSGEQAGLLATGLAIVAMVSLSYLFPDTRSAADDVRRPEVSP
ncbi:MAG: sodium:solute symporter family protein [Acidobacteria bacterium]|nr:MAG: sodium:solute symporter family protein [Acidobacteriota bacterium]REK01047.1 MAG: sodium:solute symporter family protein [Acidobacteriota bacterium]